MTTNDEDTKRPWYEQAIQNFHDRTDQLAREREIAESFQEDSQTRNEREQHDRYERELRQRATDAWWTNREERQNIREIKQHSPEIRDQLLEELVQKRIAMLREKDRQAYLKSITPSPDRTLRERAGDLIRGERER